MTFWNFSRSVQIYIFPDLCSLIGSYSHMMALQIRTVQRLDLRPNAGSVCCAVGPLIRPLHASLMTDRGKNESPVDSAHLSARRFHHCGRWQPLQWELEESVGRHAGTGPVRSRSWYRFSLVSSEGEGRRGGG